MKRSRKLISILLTLSLLVTLLLPLATPAAAGAGTYSVVGAKTVNDEGNAALGKIKVTFDAEDVDQDAYLYFKLPEDFTIYTDTYDYSDVTNTDDQTLGAAGGPTFVQVTAAASSVADASYYNIEAISDNEFKVGINGDAINDALVPGDDTDQTFYVDFQNIYVPSFEGDITCNIEDPEGTFSDDSVVIGKTGGGAVNVSVISKETKNDNFTVKLRIKETVDGALSTDSDSVKIVLPDGYEWTGAHGYVANSYNSIYGDTYDLFNDDGTTDSYIRDTFTADADELTFQPVAESNSTDGGAACFEAEFAFSVTDENEVKAGDITSKVSGDSDINVSELVVGKYGDYECTVKAVDADDLPTVYAGKIEQDVSDIEIDEAMEATLVNDRYVKLELPSTARWTSVPNTVSDSSVTLTFAGISGSDGNIIKYEVSNAPSNDAAELSLEDLQVALDVTAPGDLTVKVSGNAGVEGEIAIAKIASTVAAAAASKPEIKIGMSTQKVGDITITESEAGALEDNGSLVLKVPAGCEFTKLPTVTVESGDVKLDTTQIRRAKTVSTTQPTDYYQYLVIPIDNDSNTVSTIKVSDIYVNVDRTVSEGDLKVAVLGSAVLQSNTYGAPGGLAMDINGAGGTDYTIGTSGMFPATAAVAAVPVASIITPAPGETKANASFVIGATSYKVGGVDMTMDVAPYVKDGRTFLPVRYVAQAMGVADANILWDAASQKVTLIKNGTVVQLTIGSNVLLLNGAAITMDVAPELTSDRTMLPIRFIAQAFGYTVGWDEATQTVTIN